jgi:hypothetical protein
MENFLKACSFVASIWVVIFSKNILTYTKEKFSYLTISGVMGVALLVLIAAALRYYFTTPYINISEFDAEAFGQFGDAVGGLLNPIFGFLTVILLLKTLHIENKNHTRNEINSESILIESILEKRKTELKAVMNSEQLYIEPTVAGLLNNEKVKPFTISELNPQAGYSREKQFVERITEKLSCSEITNSTELSELCSTPLEMHSFKTVWRARRLIKDIEGLYIQLIKISDKQYFRDYQREKLTEIYYEYLFIGLVSPSEFNNLMERA